MSKRALRPLYPHQGYTMRPVTLLADGTELLHCTKRKTYIDCRAIGHRSNGVITIDNPHQGHDPDEGLVQAQMARIAVKQNAMEANTAPRDVISDAKVKYGVRPIVVAGSTSSLTRMIHRAREQNCPDTEAANAVVPVFKGKMAQDANKQRFMIFDKICTSSGGRNVAFGNEICLKTLEMSDLLLSDATFAVARAPFRQLWTLHAKFADSTVPVINILMTYKSIEDYEDVLHELKLEIPNWNPRYFIGDLEIGQARAITNTFPGIVKFFCYFHTIQAWIRKLKALKLNDFLLYGNYLYDFWSILKCLPFAPLLDVENDFDALVQLIPTPLTQPVNSFVEYMTKFYIGPRVNLLYPPATWNVSDRSRMHLPRTTNSVESHHRNLEKVIVDTRGRAAPLLSDLVKSLRQEACKLEHDKEALGYDPSYQISSSRKIKDILKDDRILKVLNNPAPLRGIEFLKAVRSAKRYT